MTLVSAVNVSEGRDRAVLDAIAAAAGDRLLDLHADPWHHRAVVTVAGEEAVRAVAGEALRRIDLRRHDGVHPRLGAVDVVPFAPGPGASLDEAVDARRRTIAWFEARGVPAVAYGAGERSLPEVRRTSTPPATAAGMVAVGARLPLVAYNVVLAEPDLERARAIARAVRSPQVRALGFPVGERVQVSMNLVDPLAFGPDSAYDAVAACAKVLGAELVGLVPEAVLDAVDPSRWAELDLAADRTVEARLAAVGH